MAGFWHWAVANLPATVTSSPAGAGDDTDSRLPSSTLQLPHDARAARFIGGAPLVGHCPHCYVITIHALDVDDVGVPADSTPDR